MDHPLNTKRGGACKYYKESLVVKMINISYLQKFLGMQLDALTSSYCLQQLVIEPIHLLPSSSSCIDLIFTEQPSLVVSSGAHPTFLANCHHQITYSKLNSNLSILLHTNA